MKKFRYRAKWLPQAQFAGAYMAKEMGFYARRGLDVEIQPSSVTYSSYDALVDGESDVVTLFLVTALRNYHNGPRLVNLAQVSQKNSTFLVGKKSTGIKTIEDLEGKKIGVWRDNSGDYVRSFIDDRNLDVTVVPIDWSVNLLLNDAIDMMSVMDYNEYHRILMAGINEDELVKFDLSDYGFDLIDDGLYATEEFYINNKEACIAFAEATMDGWIYAFNHREETLDVVLKYLRDSYLPANRAHQAWMLDVMRTRVLKNPEAIGYLDKTDFDRFLTNLMEHKWVTQPIEYNSFYPHAIKKKN